MSRKLKKKLSDALFTVIMIIMALFPFLFVAWLCFKLFMNLA